MYKQMVEALDVEVRRALLFKNHYHADFNIRVKPAGMTAWRRASGTSGIYHQSMFYTNVYKKGHNAKISEAEFMADWAKVVSTPYFLALSCDPTDVELKLDTKRLPIIGVNLYSIERRDEPMIMRNIYLVGLPGKLEATAMRVLGAIPTVGPESQPYDDKQEFGIFERRELPWKYDYALGNFDR